MGKNKLKKFADMESFSCVLQYPREKLLAEGFPYVGKWNSEVLPGGLPTKAGQEYILIGK